ncbi:MAG: GHMP kinase [Methanobacteriota archaeon]|nr:MAG: GHMP kinase [Euryarchaeota archaeon]
MVSEGEAFCPGHVTAFFEVREDPDPRKKGSRGAGLCLSLGVRTVARVRDDSRASIDVIVNGRRQRADVTRRVAEKILGDRSCEVKILSETSLPVSQGFGVSAAAAVSTALALDDALGAKIPRDELVAVAHETEVECGTGLGDVVPASIGGMDLRLKPGAPGYAEVRTFPVEAELLLAVIGAEMPTKTVLRDSKKVAAINRIGGALVDEFSENPTLERLFELGVRFAEGTGLADKRVLEVIRASRMFGRATMAMLGHSVVATGNRQQLATLYLKFGTLQRCEVDNRGARVL